MKAPISVSDPFGAASDAAMPTLALALDPIYTEAQLKRRLPGLCGKGKLRLKAIRVTRHKPGRRCMVEYDLRISERDGGHQRLTLIGKIRARRSGNEGYRLLKQIWDADFGAKSADHISVPEPIGVLSQLRMWFQRKVSGELAGTLLLQPGAVGLAGRIAAAIHKLHRAGIPTDRVHSMADELRILQRCLTNAAELAPHWSARLKRILDACQALGQRVPEPQACGIHRDFYPAQVLVKGKRIFLIDFDLYCLGDPALDIGNFIGHMHEQSLRELGDVRALDEPVSALTETFLKLSGEKARMSIEAYGTLTLVRHIYLSMILPERQRFSGGLLEICEGKLGLG